MLRVTGSSRDASSWRAASSAVPSRRGGARTGRRPAAAVGRGRPRCRGCRRRPACLPVAAGGEPPGAAGVHQLGATSVAPSRAGRLSRLPPPATPARSGSVRTPAGTGSRPPGWFCPSGRCWPGSPPNSRRRLWTAAASGRMAVESLDARHDRGRTHVPPAWRAAESWVRATERVTEPGDLWCEPDPDGHTVVVHHVDGRTWVLLVTPEVGAPPRIVRQGAQAEGVTFAVERRG